MIKVENVKFGFAPYGSASGLLVFNIELSSDNVKVEELDESLKTIEYYTDTGEENSHNRNFYYPAIGEKLYKEVVDKVVDNGMEDFWEDALLSKHFIFFSGKGLTSKENIIPFCSLIDTIGKFSLEPQREKFQEYSDYIVAHNGQQPNWQPLPPKLGLYMEPETFTGMDDFYPQFNIVYIPLKLYNEKKEYINKNDVNVFSLIEMMHNPFSIYVAQIDSVDDMKAFKDIYLSSDELPLYRDRIFVVLNEYNQEIIDMMVDEKVRLNIRLKGEDILTMN